MTAALPEAVRAAGTPIEVWFQDEARVGQQGTLTYVWAERGSRPRALKDLRYEWAYLFGAVCAERGVGAALVLPYANANAMTLHLAEVSRQVAAGAHAVLVCDGASWHKTSGRLRVPENITLLRLPPLQPGVEPGRTRVLPPQGLAAHRNPLRPQRHELHGCHQPRRRRHLVAVMGSTASSWCGADG